MMDAFQGFVIWPLWPVLLILNLTFLLEIAPEFFPLKIYSRKVVKCGRYPSDCEHICQLLANAFKISLQFLYQLAHFLF